MPANKKAILEMAVVIGLGLATLGSACQVRHVSKRNAEQEQRMRTALVMAQQGRTDWRAGRLKSAESTFRKVYAAVPMDGEAYDLARVLAQEGKYAEARKLYLRILTPDGTHNSSLVHEPIAAVEYAEICRNMGDTTLAALALKKAGVANWYEAYMTAAKNCEWRQDWDGAVKNYRKALAERPSDPAATKAITRNNKAHA